MKIVRNILKLLIIVILLLIVISLSIETKSDNKIIKYTIEDETKVYDTNILKLSVNIKDYQKKYNNKEIIGYIEIPKVLKTPFTKTNNNNYYLEHDLYKNKNLKGTIFMDNRTNFNDRKVIIYGHSGNFNDLPFLKLNNYINEDYYKSHKYIYIASKEITYTYEIFSAYIETEDYYYINLDNFNGLSWEEHLTKLKKKSLYKTKAKVDKDSKIIILQTCSTNNTGHNKFQLVMGVLIGSI